MRNMFTAIVLSTAMIGQGITPVMAQIRPAPETRPVPLPQPVPDRPVPLPRPIPGRPEIQPPRPNPGYPGYGNRPGYGQNRGYAGRITCESRNNRTRRCNARTDNRVVLISRSGNCVQGRSWGYDRRSIWVSRNCRGTFAYGYGRHGGNDWGNDWGYDRPDRDKGPSTGLVIGGVAVAAGLIALLASQNKSKTTSATTEPSAAIPPTYSPGPPAAISADLSSLRAEARPSMQTCLSEASRQIGATGGTRLRLDRLTNIEPGNGGWRFSANLVATYPDGDRAVPIFCRATPTQVVQLDFTT